MQADKRNRPFSEDFLQRLFARLAREDSYVFLESNGQGEDSRCSYLFVEPRARISIRKGDGIRAFFAEAERWLQRGCHVAGWIAYEFGYLLDPVLEPLLKGLEAEELACLWCFDRALVHDHCEAAPSSLQQWLDGQAGHPLPFEIAQLRVAENRPTYIEHIRKIKQYIAAGDTYQVNYTTSLRFDFTGSPEGMYLALRRNQSVSYGSLIKDGGVHILSLSPELFFRTAAGRITVRPMKGTVRRGFLPAEDEELRQFLRTDIKNRSENVMIVDLLRNDLGRVCERPSVLTRSLFDVETYETLHQMTSTIEGRLSENFSWRQVFTALFPCGSVTGAPKIRTMEIIRQLEAQPRGVYTGAIGFIDPTGAAAFSVPIRTARVEGCEGSMGIGSGIVFDSDPDQEWQECLLKGRFLSDPVEPFQLIETLYWHPDRGFWLEEEHLERLLRSAAFLHFHCERSEVEWALRKEVARYEEGNRGQEGRRVRLLLSKDGTLTVSSAECPAPNMEILPPECQTEELPVVCLAAERVDSGRCELYHKTTKRTLFDRLRQLALEQGCWEVLFANERGEITEGSISNVFVRTEAGFLTPPVRCGLLAGVFRGHFMKNCPLSVREQVLSVEDLKEAKAVYVGNSVRGLVQVRFEATGLPGAQGATNESEGQGDSGTVEKETLR